MLAGNSRRDIVANKIGIDMYKTKWIYFLSPAILALKEYTSKFYCWPHKTNANENPDEKTSVKNSFVINNSGVFQQGYPETSKKLKKSGIGFSF